jgi:hypothetical protein
MDLLRPGYPLPEFMETRSVVRKGKTLHVGSIRTAPVPVMFVFAHISGHDKRFSIDYSKLFCFNLLQGYTSFFGLDYQLASWFQIEKEYSLLIWA